MLDQGGDSLSVAWHRYRRENNERRGRTAGLVSRRNHRRCPPLRPHMVAKNLQPEKDRPGEQRQRILRTRDKVLAGFEEACRVQFLADAFRAWRGGAALGAGAALLPRFGDAAARRCAVVIMNYDESYYTYAKRLRAERVMCFRGSDAPRAAIGPPAGQPKPGQWGVQVFLPSEKECWPLVGHVRFAVRPDAEHPKAARRVVADI